MMVAAIDLTGQRFGRWTVLKLSRSKTVTGHRLWECQCDCGSIYLIPRANLRSGASKGCRVCQGKAREIHGHAKRGEMSPTYRSWHKMMCRCYGSAVNDPYFNYGARGISVTERWHSFVNFLADMGERPEGKTLDRYDNDADYELNNCRWATPKEQAQNRRI